MADKTDIENLLSSLERLCLEHRAMRALWIETDPHWRTSVSKYCRAPAPGREIEKQFREVHESLLSGKPNAEVIQRLTDAVNKTTL